MKLRRTTKPAGLRRRRKASGEGFTLLELMVALLVLGIVLGAVAPAFYGVLRAGSMTNYRSVANGIAVQATEQMRSYAYYEVGYHGVPTGCPDTAANPAVQLSSSTWAPLEQIQTDLTTPVTQKVGNVTYTVLRCVNWVDSTVSSDTLAYKQTYVKVSWSLDGASSSISENSALYPGGNSSYVSGGEQNWAPSPTTTVLGTTPDPPTSVTAAADGSGSIINVSWTAASGVSCYNIWFGPTNPGSYAESTMSDALGDMDVCGTSGAIDVNPSTNYYIQVVSVGTAGTSNPASATPWPVPSGGVGSTTTTTTTTTVGSGGPTTTTTSTTTVLPTTTLPCSATGITVSPAGQNADSQQAYLNSKTDTLVANSGSFQVTLTLSGSGCIPQVAYNPAGCLPGSTGCTASYLSVYTTSGNQYTFSTDPNIVWTDKAWEQFIPVVNSSMSTTLSAQSFVCVENGNSGKCG